MSPAVAAFCLNYTPLFPIVSECVEYSSAVIMGPEKLGDDSNRIRSL